MTQIMLDRLLLTAACAVGVAACASGAGAKRCSTTDDGAYACSVTAADEGRSFTLSAPGKPTYILNVEEPGLAYGFVDFGEGPVPLPGRYLRSEADPACWQNAATETEICVR